MPKVWNIGNTTVRNPKRIENALRVFVEEGFSGNAKGSEVEARLHAKLKEREILEYDGEPSDWAGRKWRAAFYQLGFISYDRYELNISDYFQNINIPSITKPFELTPAGRKLIEAKSIPEIDEIYTRQFACLELPNSLEGGFPEGKMKPFILLLQVLIILHEIGNEGINKFETGLFLQKFRDHTPELPYQIVEEILLYRQRLAECKTPLQIRNLRNEYKQKLQAEIGINADSVVGDYSDTTFRYFLLSGLFSRIGQSLVIRANKIDFVNELLETEPAFSFTLNSKEYFETFYKNSFKIPTDNKTFSLHEIELLKAGIKDKKNPLLVEANKLNEESDISEIVSVRFRLIEYNNWEREVDYANDQQSEESINEILKYLRVLNGEVVSNPPEIDDKPAYLEWAVWRSFLAIDEIVSPIHTTRRFPIDQDFYPRNTAPGGGSDLLFEFKSFILVVEVTLTTSHRQMAVESEPVRRHTVQYKDMYPDKDVYCLFIAPSVDNNVAETFRIGVWYNEDVEEFINIVPMKLSDFITAFEILKSKRYKNTDFQTLIDRCLAFRNVRAPQWKNSITNEVDVWKKRLIAI